MIGDYRAMSAEELRDAASHARRRASRVWCRGGRRARWTSVLQAAEQELVRRELASRPDAAGPTEQQRAFLELLRQGRQSSFELAHRIDFENPRLRATLVDAVERGWVSMTLGGIGGLMARPPTWFEFESPGASGPARFVTTIDNESEQLYDRRTQAGSGFEGRVDFRCGGSVSSFRRP